MTAPGEPRIIVDAGRLVVAEHGPNVVVIDRGDGPTETTAFVFAIVTLVCGGFGLVSMLLAASGSTAGTSVVTGAVLLAVGVLAGFGLFAAVRALRRARRAPLSTITPVAVFDRSRRQYLDGGGQVVAPLDHVRFQRRMQIGSSSPKLVVTTPAGTRVLMRGNPFAGSVGNIDEVLTARDRFIAIP